MRTKSTLATAFAAIAILSGCASGGGGGDDDEFLCAIDPLGCALVQAFPPNPNPRDCCTPQPNEVFTKWEDHVWDRVDARGLQVSMGYGSDSSGKVNALFGANVIDGVGVTAYYDPSKQLGSLEVGAVRFGRPYGGFQGFPGHPEIDIAFPSASASGDSGLLANPYRLGWSYQSFGTWDSHAAGNTFGATSFGAATPANAVPAGGNASFSGKLAGFHVSPAGETSMAAAQLTVNVDFATRTLGFASQETTTYWGAAPNLNLAGTLTYAPGSGTFSGTLMNAGGTMSGASTGRFHGPAAQELGGVFTLKSPTTVETFSGAYGAKR